MAISNFTWDYWVLQGSGWAIGYKGTGSVEVTRSPGSDTATVVGKMKVTSLGGDQVHWTIHMSVDGTEYSSQTSYRGHTAGQEYTISITRNIQVPAAAGSLSIKLWMTIDDVGRIPGYKSEVKSTTLAYDSKGLSAITSAENRTLGQAVSVTWTPRAAAFTFKLRFSIGNWSYTTPEIAPGGTSAYTYTGYTLPIAAEILAAIPNSRTGQMSVRLETFDASGTSLGTDTKTFTVTIPDTAATRPTISGDVSKSGVDTTFNRYVVGYSKLTLTVVAYGNNGSTPTNAVFAVGNDTYTATFSKINNYYRATITTPELSVSGTIAVVTTIYDSRGLSATQSTTITVFDYFAPRVAVEVSVVDTTVTIEVTGSIAPVGNVNAKSLQITRKKISDGTTVTIYPKTTQSSYTISQTIVETLSDVETESYEYTATLYDSKYTSGVSRSRKTGIVCISRLAGGLGVAIFREATADDLGRVGVKGYMRLQGRATDDDPTGYLLIRNDGVKDYRDDDTLVFSLARASRAGDGTLNLFDTANRLRTNLSGQGALYLYNEDNQYVASLYQGPTSKAGLISLRNATGVPTFYAGGGYQYLYNNAGAISVRGIGEGGYLGAQVFQLRDPAAGTNKNIVDHVVEEGTNTGWFYRKWSSGKIEAWRNVEKSNLAINTAWGSNYYGSIGNFTYPFAYAELPFLQASISYSDGGNTWLSPANTGSKTTTPNYYAMRATAATVTKVILSLYVMGTGG